MHVHHAHAIGDHAEEHVLAGGRHGHGHGLLHGEEVGDHGAFGIVGRPGDAVVARAAADRGALGEHGQAVLPGLNGLRLHLQGSARGGGGGRRGGGGVDAELLIVGVLRLAQGAGGHMEDLVQALDQHGVDRVVRHLGVAPGHLGGVGALPVDQHIAVLAVLGDDDLVTLVADIDGSGAQAQGVDAGRRNAQGKQGPVVVRLHPLGRAVVEVHRVGGGNVALASRLLLNARGIGQRFDLADDVLDHARGPHAVSQRQTRCQTKQRHSQCEPFQFHRIRPFPPAGGVDFPTRL